MASDDVDEAFNALNQRFASELGSDADSRLTDSLNALWALAEDDSDLDEPDSPVLDIRAPTEHGEADPEDELGRVVAALKLDAARYSSDEPDGTDQDLDEPTLEAENEDYDEPVVDAEDYEDEPTLEAEDEDYDEPVDDIDTLKAEDEDYEDALEAEDVVYADEDFDEPVVEIDADEAEDEDYEDALDAEDVVYADEHHDEPVVDIDADDEEVLSADDDLEEAAEEAGPDIDTDAEETEDHVEVAAAIEAAFDRIQTEADRPLPEPDPAPDEVAVAEPDTHVFSSLVEDLDESETPPTEVAPDEEGTELPPFLEDWTRTPDEDEAEAPHEPSRPDPAAPTDDTFADDGFDDEIPAFVNTGEVQAIVAHNDSESTEAPLHESSPNPPELQPTAAAEDTAEDTDALPIIPLGAARLNPLNAAPLDGVESQQFPQLSVARPLGEPSAVSTAPAPTPASPQAPWMPRMAAVAGIALLIIGSAVLWISLLGSPGSSDASGTEDTATGTLATAAPTAEAQQETEELASGVERGRVTVNDDRLNVEITRCDANGMRGEISTGGDDWITTRIQARFVSEGGTVLTTSNPVEELVPTTIRVPFRFEYEPSLAPAGFENHTPWCEVTVEALPSS